MLTFNARFDIDSVLDVQLRPDVEFAAAFEDTASFDADMQNLMIVKQSTGTLVPATKTRLGGIIVGNNLSVTENGTLSVDMSEEIEKDNTRPISSAQVYTSIGNINALLNEI